MTIMLSPIRRSYTSPKFRKHRKYHSNLSLTIPKMISSPTIITISCKKQNLPDLVKDLFIEQQQQHQRRETIINIARTLRKVGDQMDEQLQIDHTSSSDHLFGQRTITFIHCLSHILRFFL